jgi:hypothetical protein
MHGLSDHQASPQGTISSTACTIYRPLSIRCIGVSDTSDSSRSHETYKKHYTLQSCVSSPLRYSMRKMHRHTYMELELINHKVLMRRDNNMENVNG